MIRIPTMAALLASALVAACGPAPPAAGPTADGWYEFAGTWNATGRRHTIPMGGDRSAALLDLTGTLLLSGPARPGVGFGGEAVVLSDTQTGMNGRAVWTDEDGNRVFSEITGDGAQRGHRVTGTIVGGTGRYAGATGTYAFTWQYVLETADGTVQGRSLDIAGRIHVPPRAAMQGSKP